MMYVCVCWKSSSRLGNVLVDHFVRTISRGGWKEGECKEPKGDQIQR